jgi:hypothetical protein
MIKITLTKQNTPKLMADKLPAIIKAALIETAKLWRRDALPTHFATGAAVRYRYQKRTDKYQNRKRRMGNPPAMVYSGKARQRMLADRREPTGTAKKITLKVASFGFFNYTYKTWPQGHTMAKEVAAMTPEDLKKIHADTQRLVTEKINAARVFETQVLRG